MNDAEQPVNVTPPKRPKLPEAEPGIGSNADKGCVLAIKFRSDYGRFTKALGAGHLTEALMYAADIRVVALPDALRILELMARDGDQRFSRAASR